MASADHGLCGMQPHARSGRAAGYVQRLRHANAIRIGLNDLNRPRVNEAVKLVRMTEHLAGRDRQVRRGGKARHTLRRQMAVAAPRGRRDLAERAAR